MRSVIVYSGKGGVGKTTTTINLANALTEQGKRVYIIDADINTPSCHVLLGKNQDVNERLRFNSLGLVTNGFMIITGSMVKQYIKDSIKDMKAFKPDVVLIDTPPSITDTHINLMKSIELSGIVIVTQPTNLSYEDTKRTLGFFELNETPIIGLIENMSGSILNDSMDYSNLGVKVLTSIPFATEFQDTIKLPTDLSLYHPVIDGIMCTDTVDIKPSVDSIKHSNVTVDALEARLSQANNTAHILKFYNVETWDFIVEKLEDYSQSVYPDKLLEVCTTERIKRLLAAFDGQDEAFFMITNALRAPGNLFAGEVGSATLSLDSDSYYGIPRIKYQTDGEVITLFPDEVMPISYKDLARFTSEDGFKPVNDKRFLPPKETVREIVNAFGGRTDWESRYDAIFA